MMRTIDAAMPAEEIGRRARRPGLPGRHRATSGRSPTSACSAARSWRWSTRRATTRRDTATVLDFWERAAAGLPRRRHPPGVGHRHVHASTTTDHRRRPARRGGADRRRRAPRPRSSGSTPRSSTTCSSSTSTPGRATATPGPTPCPATPAASLLVRDFYRLGAGRLPVVRRSPRTCRTTTSPPRSCSTTSRARSPTSARPTTRPRTTSTASSAFGLYTTDGLPPGRAPPGARRRARRHRRRRPPGPGAALPQHRGHGPRREDPGRRLRVLQLPAAVRRDRRRRRRARLDRARATCPSRSTSCSRRCRARTPASPRTRPYYEPYPEVAR